MGTDDVLVIDRTYELLKWYLGRLEKLPRSHRYGLGQRIESTLYAVFEGLVRARYAARAEKAAALSEVNLRLETLRMYSRLAHDMAMLPHNSYEFAARATDEIGRMVGGWLKQQRASGASSRS